MRSVSSFTKSSIASTIHAGVKTSPWSATRCLDLTWFMGRCISGDACSWSVRANVANTNPLIHVRQREQVNRPVIDPSGVRGRSSVLGYTLS